MYLHIYIYIYILRHEDRRWTVWHVFPSSPRRLSHICLKDKSSSLGQRYSCLKATCDRDRCSAPSAVTPSARWCCFFVCAHSGSWVASRRQQGNKTPQKHRHTVRGGKRTGLLQMVQMEGDEDGVKRHREWTGWESQLEKKQWRVDKNDQDTVSNCPDINMSTQMEKCPFFSGDQRSGHVILCPIC